MSGWFFPLLIFLVLLMAWRVIVVGQRYHRTDYGNRWLNWLEGFNRLFCLRYHRLEHDPLELPDTGPALVVANHLSGLDALLLIAMSNRPLRFMIAREHYNWPGFTWLFRAIGCIPVDRERRPERALRAALKALRDGNVIALFPHGKIHLDSDPPRRIKAGALRLAQLTGSCILPLRITGVVGVGHVVRGVLRRSSARVDAFPAIDVAGREPRELLSELQQILDGKR